MLLCVLYYLCLFGLLLSSVPFSPPQPEPLLLGETRRGTLQPDEVRRYQLPLPPQSYAHLLVTQNGVRLTATIYNAQGQRQASGERSNQMHGPKYLHLIATDAQPYQLEIRAGKDTTAGQFTVTWLATRPATAREEHLITAQKIFADAMALAPQNTTATRLRARDLFQRALQHYQAAADIEGQALTFTELGLVAYLLSEPQESLALYKTALPLWRKLHDTHGEARTLNNLGVTLNGMGDLVSSKEQYQQALPLWRAIGDPNGEARTILNVGNIYFLLGEWQEALQLYDKALADWQQGGDRYSIAWVLNSKGVLYATLGDTEQARQLHEQALAVVASVTNKTREVNIIEPRILNNLGEVCILRNEDADALRYLNQAATLRRQMNDRDLPMTLANLAFVRQRNGQRTEALALYEEALQLARPARNKFVEATILKKLGELWAPEKPELARQFYQQSRAMFQAGDEKDSETEVIYDLAQLERAQGNPKAALALLQTVLQSVEGLRTNVGSKDLRALFFARKQDYFESYIDLLMQQQQMEPTAQHDRLAWQANERARARSLLDWLAASNTEIQHGAAAELLTHQQKLSQQIVRQTHQLFQLKKSPTAPSQLAPIEQTLRTLHTEYEQVQAQIRQQNPRYAELTQPQPATLAQVQTLLDEKTILLQYTLGQAQSYLWVITPQTFTSYVLPNRAEIEATATTVYELLTAPQPRSGESFAERVARIKAAESQWPVAAAKLSRMLLAPAAPQLGTKRLVIVPDGVLHAIPFAALPDPVGGSRMPVAGKISAQVAAVGKGTNTNRTQNSDYRSLVVNHEIAYLPSASVLAAQRKERTRTSSTPIPLALFADPVFSADDFRVTPQAKTSPKKIALATQITRGIGSTSWLREEIALPRLQFSRQEANAIQQLAPRGTVTHFDFQANREAALKPDWQRARLLHFATHTLLDDQHPALSGIVLSLVNADGSPRPGFLQLHDLYNLDLHAELVVLSACRTARGQELRGEGIIGLTRGFFYSGAQRVVSSLWNIDDNATARLMKAFYAAMWEDHLRPAAALQQAQRKMQQEHPYYWSAFVLHGDWQ